MAEVMGTAASILGILDVSIKASTGLLELYQAIRDAPKNIAEAISELELLNDELNRAQSVISLETQPGSPPLDLGKYTTFQNMLVQLQKDVQKDMKRTAWAFKKKQISGDIGLLQKYRDAVRSDIILGIGYTQKSQEMERFLSPWNVARQHTFARDQRQEGTGCGKSVLASTIIDALLRHRQCSNQNGINRSAAAWFYFDFREAEHQTVTRLLTSLVWQLGNSSRDAQKVLMVELGTFLAARVEPTSENLLECLEKLTASFGETFIVLDALDECRNDQKTRLLKALAQITTWKKPAKVLATSRREHNIERALMKYTAEKEFISLQGNGIDDDIRIYIRSYLQDIDRFQGDADAQLLIENELVRRAGSMFRWVQLQLMDIADAYHECDEEGKTLKALLDSLPQDLDQTYARILKNIPEKNREKALKLLRWLSFTARPLTIREAAEALAIRVADDPDKTGFNPSAKFRSPCEILQLCPGMINKIIKTGKGPITATGITESDEIMLAHFSVKEYLRSDGILSEGLAEEKTGRLSYFSVREQPTNCYQARACLAYMSHLKHRDITEELLTKYPLATYSAQFWPTHARLAKIEDSKDAGLIQDADSILKSTDGLLGWIKLFDPDHQKPQQDATRDMIRSPLYYVSLCGLSHHTKLLIDQKFELEASGGCYHRPLLAACRRGFPEVVRHLLDAGADFKFRVDKASAMMCAVKAGHIEIVRLLLNKEKEVNPAKDIAHFDAALVACTRGYKDIVNLILAQSKGTNVNDDNGYPRSTLTLLQEAATRGHDGLVRLLLDLGAEIDREGGWYGTAIRAAALEGHFPVVKTLLDRGANPMLHGGSPGSALIAAISFDRHRIVDLLLQSELTDVNYNEGMPGSALQSAASKGKLEFVRKLLQSGARVNAEGGLYHSALQAACARGHDAIVDVLLDHGATVDTPEQGPADVISITPKGDITAAVYLVPYHKAGLSPEDWHGADFMRLPSDTTDDKIKQLLSSEPLIAVQKGIYGSALRAAIFGGHRNIANRLLEAGANIYAQGGAPHSLMHIMAMAGNEEMRQLFPDNEGTADSASHATHWKLDVLFTVKDKLSEEKLQAIKEKHQALGGSILDVGSFDGGKRQAWLNLSWDR